MLHDISFSMHSAEVVIFNAIASSSLAIGLVYVQSQTLAAPSQTYVPSCSVPGRPLHVVQLSIGIAMQVQDVTLWLPWPLLYKIATICNLVLHFQEALRCAQPRALE